MGGTAATVLVVDDEAALRMLCRVNLELDGYRVLEAGTVGDARRLLAREAVAVVLLDLDVGGESGPSLLDDLHGRPRPRVALFTGSSSIDEALRARVDAVVRKPFSLDELARTVARLAAAAR